jgi:hypothetical protein
MRLEGPRERDAAMFNAMKTNITQFTSVTVRRWPRVAVASLCVAMRYDRVESRCVALSSGAKRENSAARRLTRILGRTDE